MSTRPSPGDESQGKCRLSAFSYLALHAGCEHYFTLLCPMIILFRNIFLKHISCISPSLWLSCFTITSESQSWTSDQKVVFWVFQRLLGIYLSEKVMVFPESTVFPHLKPRWWPEMTHLLTQFVKPKLNILFSVILVYMDVPLQYILFTFYFIFNMMCWYLTLNVRGHASYLASGSGNKVTTWEIGLKIFYNRAANWIFF